MKHRVEWLLALVVIASMVVTGCAAPAVQQAAPTVAAKLEEKAAEVAPTVAAAVEEVKPTVEA